MIKYFDYEIFKELKNAKYLHKKGFFVGNHQKDISEELHLLHKIINGGGDLSKSYILTQPLEYTLKVA